MSTILGVLLAGGTWIARATLFVGRDGKGGIIQNYGSIQEVLFLEVALTESWLILITRVSSPPRRMRQSSRPKLILSPTG